ncbi:MAG: Sec-independent protein translocase subunit TatA/TatB [Aridibacter sp.]
MYLFILETIGTQELILVGIIALIVFGPRKLPLMAKKAGEFMRELKSVSSEFKSTWEKEVNFEETSSRKPLENNSENYIGEGESFGKEISKVETNGTSEHQMLPQIKEVSSEDFEKLIKSQKEINPEPIDKIISEKSEKSEWF